MIDGYEGGENEVTKITGSVVKEAACRLKPGKGDVSEGYTSDAILNAPDILFDKFALVYKSWLYHGTIAQKHSEKSSRGEFVQSYCWI